MKLLWVGNIGDYSSFSRISSSILPHICEKHKVTLLTSAKNTIPNDLESKIDVVRLGADTKMVSWEEFKYSWDMSFRAGQQFETSDSLSCQMKYSIIQIADILSRDHYDYLIICNGIYESNWFVQTLKESEKDMTTGSILNGTKLVVWTPIDYIPTLSVVRWVLEADILLTMTPVMVEELNKINKILKNDVIIDWIGHGSDITNTNSEISRRKMIKNLNKLRGSMWNGPKLEEQDVIILNANNCVSRKRLDLTIESFHKLLEKNPLEKRIKLWIHTDMKKFSQMVSDKKLHLGPNIIVSHNTIGDKELQMIYKVCQIGLQTSTGEGWSLTNCEHAMFGSLQVVPDFLATRFHFKDDRGILIPVSLEKTKNEANHSVSIGVPDVENIIESLEKAIQVYHDKELLTEYQCKSKEYVSSYKWKDMADKIMNVLKNK